MKATYYSKHKEARKAYQLAYKVKHLNDPRMKEYRKRENETRRLKRGLKSTKSYDELFQLQSGKCAICQRKSPDRNLSFDHDHKTGNARGLLCFRCNLGLGYFQDNINYLGEAIFYLKNNIA